MLLAAALALWCVANLALDRFVCDAPMTFREKK